MDLETCALVLLGGFVGGISRFFISGVVGRRVGETFPWGTLVVNVTGAFIIGAVVGLGRASGGIFISEPFRAFVMVGLLGGYTTVSSFSLQTLNLALDGELWQAAFNVIASAGLCVVAVGAGFWLVLRVLE
jgi:fluoride exporter